jgi:hypothetical protein
LSAVDFKYSAPRDKHGAMSYSWKTIVELQHQLARRLAEKGRYRSSTTAQSSARILQQRNDAFKFRESPPVSALPSGLDYAVRMISTDSSLEEGPRSERIILPPAKPFDFPFRLSEVHNHPLWQLVPKKGTGTLCRLFELYS